MTQAEIAWLAWYPWAEQIFRWLRSAVLCSWTARAAGDWRVACAGCGGNHWTPEAWAKRPAPLPLTEPEAIVASLARSGWAETKTGR